ncbi:putative multidrug resistance ABC transporter ATP-binding/permease protein YheH [Paenibacillus solanacearum]|uniref:Multidrug resistance ABC transporter ATP-binding/permease protein YheH n=1 Tax=Paenibacillus solanacearum TaxID=2048548 RepID=A0A916JSE6_9BACL|nr:ABC transporter ATP-binding protein [Paenibacillus solanacearum]CAG7599087.1 putative multidrug resistance ABC transporter ATP-binding/permease protein YheH [Paenibacillus solanacearum]
MSIHEETQLTKAYDLGLIGRLLRYAKPHYKKIMLSICLVVLITIADLCGPYLIKIAIDDHINGISLPMVDVSGTNAAAVAPAVSYGSWLLVRERELEGKFPLDQLQGKQRFRIVKNGMSTELAELSASGGTTVVAQLAQADVDRFRSQDIGALYRLSGFYLLLVSATFLLNYTQTYTLNLIAQKIIYTLRANLFAHLQRLSFRFFDRNPVGRLVTRVTNDTQTLNDMYSNVMINLIKDVFMLIGIMIVMLSLNVRLALVSFLTLPLIIAATLVYRKYAREAMREVRIKLAQINATLNENITGMRVVQMFHREAQQNRKVEAINRSHFDANTKELHVSSLYRPVMDFVYAIGLALLIWFGGGQMVQGAVEFGVLYAFVDYINRFFKPIQDLAEKFTILQQSMVSSERIFELLDEKDDLPEPARPIHLEKVEGSVVFDNVSFAYNPGEWVLKQIDLTIKPGETVAFVGATGAGKSSIISLLCRFYDVQEGSIRLDGTDIRDLPKQELRRHIGLVQQDVFLFSEDIKTNIRLGNDALSNEDIRRLCEYVNADVFIEKLPRGYDEPVMERGANLSAGQRQLIAIARTLAFNPSILILDEATANIDTETELLIQDAFRKISSGRTTIIVAHRLSTIQHADKIVVLHKGTIRETGTHQELLQKNGLYWKLYELQYQEAFSAEADKAATN